MKAGISKIVITLSLVLSLSLSACTKDREAEFADGEGENVFSVQSLQTSGSITTGGNEMKKSARTNLTSSGQGHIVPVISAQVPAGLKELFSGLEITGMPAKTYKVTIELNKKFLTVSKIVQDAVELTDQETQLSTAVTNKANQKVEYSVPLFQVAVKSYGILVRKKNDLDEETHNLRVKQTFWEEATHVELGTASTDRLAIQYESDKLKNQIFVKNKIHNALFTKDQLQNQLNINLNQEDGEALFISRFEGQNLDLFQITTEAKLTSEELKKLQAGDTSIQRCSDELKESVPTALQEGCVAVLKYEVKVRYVALSRVIVDSEGTLSSNIEVSFVSSGQEAALILLDESPVPHEVNLNTDRLDPTRVLVIKDLKDKEFLFRRTLEDSPNSFDYTFTGTSGPLELVKFKFEKDSVRVLRIDPLIETTGGNDTDVAVLMSLPAQYLKAVHTDANGNPLSVPRYISADREDPAAIAYVNWTSNRIPNVSSPLDYYSLEQCFVGPQESELSNLDQRLSTQGMLGFSVQNTYASNPSMDCAGVYQAGYFDTVQSTFTFKERFSFKLYQKGDENPLLDVPYEAQKRLGFGLFTYKKIKPNSNNNTGIDGTEIPLPGVFDLSEGKQIQYVLAGLPTNNAEVRARVIQATKEVVRDLNNAFRKALQGTPRERKDDVVVLKIEGEKGADGIEERKVGDLDRNYIYYVQKRTNATIIGLGGAHSNPRSGKVEAASSFIYGGNIFAFVDRLRKVENAQKEYHDRFAAIAQENTEIEKNTPQEDVNIENGTVEIGVEDSGLAPTSEELSSNEMWKLNVSRVSKIASQKTRLERDLQDLHQSLLSGGNVIPHLSDGEIANLKVDAVSKALYQAFKNAVNDKTLQDPHQTAATFNKWMLAAYRNQMTRTEIDKMRAHINQDQAAATLLSRMRSSNICVFDAQSAEVAAAIAGAEKRKLETDLDYMIAVYKPTLAHEIGHNIGLRHNFIGSFDAANFRFGSDDESHRDYSSVMDYMPNDHHSYDGYGPQDVASLRAAYGGVLELDESELGKVKSVDGRNVIAVDGAENIPVFMNEKHAYVKIEDYKKAILGDQSWLHLDSGDLAKLKLKPYLFCSDEEAGSSPTCNRFDEGSTPEEIVKKAADAYRSTYAIRNFPNDSLNFNWWDSGGYIGRLFSTMLPVRQMLEETFYQAITGTGQVGEYVPGAVASLMFFHEVVRTPDAPAFIQSDDRFVTLQAQDGSKVLVERKWLSNFNMDSVSDRLKVRGVEFDKVVAMIMLTERSFGFSRYEKISLRMSFPDFERMIIPNAESPLDLPTVGLLNEVLNGNIRAAINTDAGLTMVNNGLFNVEINDTVRTYAILGSILNLDVDGIEAADNNSALFRVMSGFKVPEGAKAIVAPGSNADSANILKYWADASGASSSTMLDKASTLGAVQKQKKALEPLIVKWIQTKLGIAQPGGTPEKPEPVPAIEEQEKAIDHLLKDLPESAGPLKIAEIAPLVEQVIQLSLQLEKAQGQMPAYDFSMNVDRLSTQITNLAKEEFTTALVLGAINSEVVPVATLDLILPGNRLLDQEQSRLFRNIQILNEIYFSQHGLTPR